MSSPGLNLASFPEYGEHAASLRRAHSALAIQITCIVPECEVEIIWRPDQKANEIIQLWKEAHADAGT